MTLGLFEALRREHERVLALADRLDEQAAASAGAELEGVLDEAWRQVLTCDTLEERTLCALLARDRRTNESAEEARQQSRQTEQLFAEIRSMPKGAGGRFERRIALLSRRIRDHVAWKEEELFPVAVKALSSEEVRSLEERLADERDAVTREIDASGA